MKKDTAQVALEALKQFISAYQHLAPDDCFATGPLTGDPIQDFVVCPGCVAGNMAKEAIDALEAEIARVVEPGFTGMSEEADFSTDTWTFKMDPGYRVGAGQYRITPIPKKGGTA